MGSPLPFEQLRFTRSDSAVALAGTIAQRFATPCRITLPFLSAAYTEIGLAASHIEQLTGQPAERVLLLLCTPVPDSEVDQRFLVGPVLPNVAQAARYGAAL